MLFFKRSFRRQPERIMAACGHETAKEGTVTVNGQVVSVKLNTDTAPFCYICLEKVSTSCAKCGKPILPTWPVLRTVSEGKEKIFGACCTEFGAVDCTGLWTVEGYKEVPFEELMGIK